VTCSSCGVRLSHFAAVHRSIDVCDDCQDADWCIRCAARNGVCSHASARFSSCLFYKHLAVRSHRFAHVCCVTPASSVIGHVHAGTRSVRRNARPCIVGRRGLLVDPRPCTSAGGHRWLSVLENVLYGAAIALVEEPGTLLDVAAAALVEEPGTLLDVAERIVHAHSDGDARSVAPPEDRQFRSAFLRYLFDKTTQDLKPVALLLEDEVKRSRANPQEQSTMSAALHAFECRVPNCTRCVASGPAADIGSARRTRRRRWSAVACAQTTAADGDFTAGTTHGMYCSHQTTWRVRTAIRAAVCVPTVSRVCGQRVRENVRGNEPEVHYTVPGSSVCRLSAIRGGHRHKQATCRCLDGWFTGKRARDTDGGAEEEGHDVDLAHISQRRKLSVEDEQQQQRLEQVCTLLHVADWRKSLFSYPIAPVGDADPRARHFAPYPRRPVDRVPD